MQKPIRVAQYGLGPIGLSSLRTLLKKQSDGFVEVVGAIDIDPDKVGRDVAALLGLGEPVGLEVSDRPEDVFERTSPHVAVHTTNSFLPHVADQLKTCARGGVHVVSSTEELSFPFDRYPDLSRDLDRVAREYGVVFLGTGVNPGYAMDTLALTATGVCTDVTSIRVERVVDAGKRREPLQRKVGAGLSAEAFAEKKATGTFGHIGLRESLLLVADGLDWSLDAVDESLEPVVAKRTIETPYLKVHAGEVAGIHHCIRGVREGEEVLSLDLKMYVGADEPRDAVRVYGTPPIDLVIRGGIFGDTATVAALVNAVPLVLEAQPGLRTTKDLPIPRAFGTHRAVVSASLDRP